MFHKEISIATLRNACYISADQGIALDKSVVCYKSEWTNYATNSVNMIVDFLTLKKALFHTPWQNLIENGKIRERLKVQN